MNPRAGPRILKALRGPCPLGDTHAASLCPCVPSSGRHARAWCMRCSSTHVSGSGRARGGVPAVCLAGAFGASGQSTAAPAARRLAEGPGWRGQAHTRSGRRPGSGPALCAVQLPRAAGGQRRVRHLSALPPPVSQAVPNAAPLTPLHPARSDAKLAAAVAAAFESAAVYSPALLVLRRFGALAGSPASAGTLWPTL